MFGRIVFSETKKVSSRCEMLDGLPVQTVCIPADSHGRRVLKAARLFRRRGVRRVLAPPGFSGWKWLERQGIFPVDTVPFLQAMAAPLALAALDARGISPGRATVVLAGKRANKGLCDAAAALCPRVARLVISAPVGGAELAAYLRREYGIPLLEQCRAPSLMVFFSAVDWDDGTTAPALRLYAGGPAIPGFSFCPGKTFAMGDCESLPLLAALWESGRLTVGDIAVIPNEET